MPLFVHILRSLSAEGVICRGRQFVGFVQLETELRKRQCNVRLLRNAAGTGGTSCFAKPAS